MSTAAPHECSEKLVRPVLGRQLKAEVLSAFIDNVSDVAGDAVPER